MRKEYIKPSLEVIRLETESPMALSQPTGDGVTEVSEGVNFGSRRKRQWDDEEAWDDFEEDEDY